MTVRGKFKKAIKLKNEKEIIRKTHETSLTQELDFFEFDYRFAIHKNSKQSFIIKINFQFLTTFQKTIIIFFHIHPYMRDKQKISTEF